MVDSAAMLNQTFRKLMSALSTYESVERERASDAVSTMLGTTLSNQFAIDALQLACDLAASDGVVTDEEVSFINRVLDRRMTKMSVSATADDKEHCMRFFSTVPVSFRVATAFDNILYSKGRTGTPASELMLNFLERFGLELTVRNRSAKDTQAEELDTLSETVRGYCLQTLNQYKGHSASYLAQRYGHRASPLHKSQSARLADAAGGGTRGAGSPKAGGASQTSAQASRASSGAQAAEVPSTLDELMAELDGLVGLESVKRDVRSLINLLRVRKAREERGIKQLPMSLHLVFIGNPGTGKTTVARLVAKIYAQIGILSKGQLIETDRSGLVAGYMGQTGPKVKEVVAKALGGILFIDEAYALTYRRDGRDFGFEAVDTLLKEMEDHRDDLIVIVAGYTEPMQEFLSSNPGLRSRFNKFIEFADYTPDELFGIFESFCAKNGLELTSAASREARRHFKELYENRGEGFANGRTVRNFLEKMLVRQANRLAEAERLDESNLQKITVADVRIEE